MFVPHKMTLITSFITICTNMAVLAILAVLLLSACAATISENPNNTNQNQILPLPLPLTLAQQALIAIQKNERIPDTFYKVRGLNDEFASVYHIKNIDIDPMISTSSSLSASDAEQARQWADIAILNFPGLWTYVGMNEQAWFYEFTWQTNTPYQRSLALRVFRKDVIDNAKNQNQWQQQSDGFIAQIQPTWHTEASIALLAEYLWNFSKHNNAGHAVISTHASSTAYDITFEVFQTCMADDIRANAPDDAIIILKASYHLDLSSGVLYYNERVQQTIYGENTTTGFVPAS